LQLLKTKFNRKVDLSTEPTCPLCGDTLFLLMVFPHLSKCVEDYRRFCELNSSRMQQLQQQQIDVKKEKQEFQEEKKRKTETLNLALGSPIEGSDKATVENRCDLPEHLCPTPHSKGGQNKPVYVCTGVRVVKLCKLMHLKDADPVKFIQENAKGDSMRKLELTSMGTELHW
jgi:hypothetical protein